jgi:hypothetical protein
LFQDVPGQKEAKYELAESLFDEEGWPRLRLIAVKKKNGGQTHVLASSQATWTAYGLNGRTRRTRSLCERPRIGIRCVWTSHDHHKP